jgi:hypothetical protein
MAAIWRSRPPVIRPGTFFHSRMAMNTAIATPTKKVESSVPPRNGAGWSPACFSITAVCSVVEPAAGSSDLVSAAMANALHCLARVARISTSVPATRNTMSRAASAATASISLIAALREAAMRCSASAVRASSSALAAPSRCSVALIRPRGPRPACAWPVPAPHSPAPATAPRPRPRPYEQPRPGKIVGHRLVALLNRGDDLGRHHPADHEVDEAEDDQQPEDLAGHEAVLGSCEICGMPPSFRGQPMRWTLRRADGVLTYSSCPGAGRVIPGPHRQALGDEDQDHRHDEGEQAEQLGGREADEQAALLAVGGARIAQRALKEAAEDVADADGGKTRADGGEAGADELGRIGADHARCGGFHYS